MRAAVQRGAFSPTLAHDSEVRTATEVCNAQRAAAWLFEWIDVRRREQDEESRTGHGEEGPASTDEEHLLKDEMDNLIAEIDRHAKKLRMLCMRVCVTVRMGDFSVSESVCQDHEGPNNVRSGGGGEGGDGGRNH